MKKHNTLPLTPPPFLCEERLLDLVFDQTMTQAIQEGHLKQVVELLPALSHRVKRCLDESVTFLE